MKNLLIVLALITASVNANAKDEKWFVESCSDVFDAIKSNDDSKVKHLYPEPVEGVFSPALAKGSLEKKHHKMMVKKKGFSVEYKKMNISSKVSEKFKAIGVVKLATVRFLGKDGNGGMRYPSCKFGLINDQWRLVGTPF
ncbi:hypothetical protein [Aliikangiella sp. IMCC44632]